MIELIHVAKSFGNQVRILKDVNLKIGEGESVTIIGPSGCGKSTLLRAILGLVSIDRGKIVLDNQDISELSLHDFNILRKEIGMVFQSSALFDSISVGQNVGFEMYERKLAEPIRIQRRVKECLEMVGLPNIEDVMPSELSGGMRKRVSFARAICARPKILLYDEPTTGLDPITSTAIENLIIKLKSELQVTSVVVTHQISTVLRVSDRIVMLHEGSILEAGTPQEVNNSTDPVIQKFISGEG